MKTRKEYMDGIVSHREYYGQFVTEEVKKTLLRLIGKKEILSSQDEHFNDIPIAKWDALPAPNVKDKMKLTGDYLTLAGSVCIYKEAAKQIKDNK